jgi:hypothetical protein
MHVLNFLPDAGGCGWYRQRQPLWWLNELGHKTATLEMKHWKDPVSGGPELLRQADVIVCARIQQVGVLEILRDYNPQATIVYDIDDDLFNPPSENPYSQIATSIEHESIKAHVRIGWAGSSTHSKDIEPAVAGLKIALEKWAKKKDAVSVVPAFMGHLGQIAAESFERVVWQQPVIFDQYYQMLHGLSLDIGLAPIRPHPFNNSKSSIKFLEYSALNTATIASSFGPYKRTIEHEETGLLVRRHENPNDWAEMILWLLEDKDLTDRLKHNAREWCIKNRNPRREAERLAGILEKNLKPPFIAPRRKPKKDPSQKSLTIGTLSWIPEPDERLECLKRCLPLILARVAQSKNDYNVRHVILAQGSCAEALAFLEREISSAFDQGLNVELWVDDVNRGVPAINKIFKLNPADYFMKLDDDVVPCPGFVSVMMESYFEIEKRSNIGMLAYDPEWGHETFGTRDRMKVVECSEILKTGHRLYWLKENSVAVGMCRLESAESFREAGGHPADVMYGTDQIMADKFTQAGYSNAHLIPMIKLREKGMDLPSPLAHLGPTNDARAEWKKEELHKMSEKRGNMG